MRGLRPRSTALGLGAAACAVCCAAPLMTLLGIAGVGFAATLFTALLAGLSFALVVAVATVVAVVVRRRRPAVDRPPGPVDVQIGVGP